ncbi:hypothetical protein BKA69DRAFT_1065252 [Paraphysoderma sedebokerense]|nr:hypothetical protein BKA69DRAFT_1065119 [Paraphysoderma sedebokerense]KAI9142892.1 hypothetical protein BKA69DRAFT_1065252 [Paraphysoderma sedebokerense]
MANLNPNRPKVDCTINQRQIFIRPHTDYFISSLTSIPNIDVFVWTSAKEKNAIPICQMLFKERFKSLKCIWHRAMCEPIKGTLRDTVKVWFTIQFNPFCSILH